MGDTQTFCARVLVDTDSSTKFPANAKGRAVVTRGIVTYDDVVAMGSALDVRSLRWAFGGLSARSGLRGMDEIGRG